MFNNQIRQTLLRKAKTTFILLSAVSAISIAKADSIEFLTQASNVGTSIKNSVVKSGLKVLYVAPYYASNERNLCYRINDALGDGGMVIVDMSLDKSVEDNAEQAKALQTCALGSAPSGEIFLVQLDTKGRSILVSQSEGLADTLSEQINKLNQLTK